MIDLDFLLAEKPAIKTHVLYTVKTHALRPAISTRLRTYAEARGLATRTLDYERPLLSAAENSLLSDFFIWCDLDELVATRGKTAAEDFSALATLLLDSRTENRLFIYGSDAKILAHPSYAELAKFCTHLEEAEPTVALLPKLLDLTARLNPTLELEKLTNRASFLEQLKTLLDDQVTLPDLLHAIEYYATLTIAPDSHTFDLTAFAALRGTTQKTDYYRWHRLLFNLLTSRARPAATALMRELDAARHIAGFEPRGLVTLLYKTTYELHLVSDVINKTGTKPQEWSEYKWKQLRESFRGIPPAALLTWNVHLATNEAALNQGSSNALEQVLNALLTT